MADIFVSYKHSRRAVVERIAAALRAHGWEVWFDASLTDGEQFRSEIEMQLSAARCALVLWCEESVKADFVLDEAGWAKARGALVQARWMDVNLPLGFGQQQAVDIVGWQKGVPTLSSLIATIERLIGEPGAPKRGPMGTPAYTATAPALPGPLSDGELAALMSELTLLREIRATWDQFVFRAYVEQRARLEDRHATLSIAAMIGPPRSGSLLRRLLTQLWKTTRGKFAATVLLPYHGANTVLPVYEKFLNEAVGEIVIADSLSMLDSVPRYKVLGES